MGILLGSLGGRFSGLSSQRGVPGLEPSALSPPLASCECMECNWWPRPRDEWWCSFDGIEDDPALAITVILLSLFRIVFRRLLNECE